jgi:hypothetical protein
MSYQEAYQLPIFIRHWFLNRTSEEVKKMKEQIDRESKKK